MIQFGFISSTIKSHPKHDTSVYLTIPVHLTSERIPQIRHLLGLISQQAHQTDQPVSNRALSNLVNLSTADR
jgi:hypothetical protein